MTLLEGLARLTGLKTKADCMPPIPVDPKTFHGVACASPVCQAAVAAPAGKVSQDQM